MKLYGSYTSPFVRHCRIALLETKTPCEFIEADMAASASQSPTQRVPFLQDGSFFLSDSSSILRHIREQVGETFCATARQYDQYCLINTALDACLNLFFLRKDGIEVSQSSYLQRQSNRIITILQELNEAPLPTQTIFNDVDLRLACFIGWAKYRKQLNFTPYKNLDAFYSAMEAYEPFAKTAPPQ